MTEPTHTCPLDIGELLHQLSAHRRRAAVVAAAEMDDPATIRDLSDALAERVEPSNPELTHNEHRQQMHISLYQTHLPKLTESGVFEEVRHQTYTLGPNGEQFLGALEAVERHTSEEGDAHTTDDHGRQHDARAPAGGDA